MVVVRQAKLSKFLTARGPRKGDYIPFLLRRQPARQLTQMRAKS